MITFLKGLFSRSQKKSAKEQLQDVMLQASEEEGKPSLNREERFLINNVLNMEALTVNELCVPRADIKAVSRTISHDNLSDLVKQSPHTRLPVYGKDLDDIRGLVHIKDLYAICQDKTSYSLKKAIRRCLFASPSRPVLHLLMQMRATKMPMAIVVDEQGGVDGLITYSDIVEALVGDMGDDNFQDEPFLVREKDGSYEADARLDIDEFLKTFDVALTREEEDDEIETLGGLIFSLVGRVPDRKEVISYPPSLEFEILEANPRRILKVGIHRTESKNTQQNDEDSKSPPDKKSND